MNPKKKKKKKWHAKILKQHAKFDPGGGGGHLYLKLDIILIKKIHLIRVVF